MAGVDCFQAMIFLDFLVFHAKGVSNKEEYLSLAGGNQEISEISPSPTPSMWEEEEFVPVQSTTYLSSLAPKAMMPTGEPFRTCSGCRCCSPSNSGNCVNTQCCFGIKCNLPGKPFGVCSFTPISCGCGTNNKCNNPSKFFTAAHLV